MRLGLVIVIFEPSKKSALTGKRKSHIFRIT